jgi:membrane protease YdiL (CAAX protease family)
VTLPQEPFDSSQGAEPEAGSGPVEHIPPESPAPFPAWGVADLLRVMVVLLLAIFFIDTAAVLIASMVAAEHGVELLEVASDPRVVVPAQAVAYLLTVWFIARMIRRHYRLRFFPAVRWRLPQHWLRFLIGGMVLAMVVQILSSRLPIPRQLPIEQYFRSPLAAWLMAGFGILVAPFCEELFFRGLLFPVLRQRLGMLLAVVLTSALFAVIHASQLGHAWAAVSVLFVVGVVLTLIRAMADSLAASVLVHSGYNLALFALLYAGTAGFTNFKSLTQ